MRQPRTVTRTRVARKEAVQKVLEQMRASGRDAPATPENKLAGEADARPSHVQVRQPPGSEQEGIIGAVSDPGFGTLADIQANRMRTAVPHDDPVARVWPIARKIAGLARLRIDIRGGSAGLAKPAKRPIGIMPLCSMDE